MWYYLKLGTFLLLAFVLVNSCSRHRLVQPDTPSPTQVAAFSSKTMILENRPFLEIFQGDDLSKPSLKAAIEQSLAYFNKISPSRTFTYGRLKYSAKELAASMELFLKILDDNEESEAIFEKIQKNFLIFRSPSNQDSQVLFTGYYEPIYEGSLKRTKDYRVPVYQKPDDLQILNLGRFRRSLKNRTIVYRHENERVLPYYTRKEIMKKGALKGKKLELAWMKDPVDLFFMQIQGSGIIQLPDGSRRKLSYNGSNGHPYSSIGKLLIDEGKMKLEDVSMHSIREYIHENPELKEYILYHNKSYTFFSISNSVESPKGNLNVPLTPNRSIATDALIFPKGALAYIMTKKPLFDEKWEYVDDEPMARFVLIQDTGGAIKGTGRADIFWGNGKLAEKSAGHLRSFGQMYFIVAKKNVLEELKQN